MVLVVVEVTVGVLTTLEILVVYVVLVVVKVATDVLVTL